MFAFYICVGYNIKASSLYIQCSYIRIVVLFLLCAFSQIIQSVCIYMYTFFVSLEWSFSPDASCSSRPARDGQNTAQIQALSRCQRQGVLKLLEEGVVTSDLPQHVHKHTRSP